MLRNERIVVENPCLTNRFERILLSYVRAAKLSRRTDRDSLARGCYEAAESKVGRSTKGSPPTIEANSRLLITTHGKASHRTDPLHVTARAVSGKSEPRANCLASIFRYRLHDAEYATDHGRSRTVVRWAQLCRMNQRHACRDIGAQQRLLNQSSRQTLLCRCSRSRP